MIQTMISASALILAICLIRFLLRGKINPRVQYALWGLVAVRLLVGLFYPVQQWLYSLKSRFSVMNAANRFHERVIEGTSMEFLADNLATGHVYTFNEPVDIVMKAAGIDWQLWIMVIWGIGTVVLVVWMWQVNLKLHNRFMKTRELYTGDIPAFVTKNVYAVPGLKSPCYFGFIGEDAIYLPEHVTKDSDVLLHSLAHEMGHVNQGDKKWGELRVLLLCMFWVNPLIWVAAILSKRDAELSCDEVSIELLGEKERFGYGRTLIRLVSQEKEMKDIFCAATTMAEGKSAMKARIEMIAKHPKRTVWMMTVVGCLALGLVACTFTSGVDIDEEAVEIMLIQGVEESESVSKNTEEDSFLSKTDQENPMVEIVGQTGNYYQMLLKGVSWDDAEHVIAIQTYEDTEAKKLLGDGIPEHGSAYHKNEDGSVSFNFWNTENAKALRVQMTDQSSNTYAGVVGENPKPVVYAEAIVELENQPSYSQYTLNQVMECADHTAVTLISVEEYQNALCLTISEEPGGREGISNNVFLLKMEDGETREEWIVPQYGSYKDGFWTGLYLIPEYNYPMEDLEAIVCSGRSGYMNTQTNYIVNELEYHKIRETAIQFIQKEMDMTPDDEDLVITYEPAKKETYALATYRFKEEVDSYTYLSIEMGLAFGEWKVSNSWLEK